MAGGGATRGAGLKDANEPFRLVKGDWGDPRSPKQKGIVTYAVSTNRQKPLAGTVNAAVFNTFRRTKSQILYWGVPILFAYSALEWADRRNHFLNSKAGRMHDAETEKE